MLIILNIFIMSFFNCCFKFNVKHLIFYYIFDMIITRRKDMKFTIIMPTYNDSESIIEALDSVVMQTYKNWELLISDDGSTDDTREIIQQYLKKKKEKRIKYYYHNNQDQLNAILNIFPYITGDYIYILHSDDLLADKYVLEKALKEFKNSKIDALISSPIIINEKSEITGNLQVKKYKKSESTIALQLLWLGRNLYTDTAFHTYKSFTTTVKYNYLTWNTPFWLDLREKPAMLNVKNAIFPFFKYRIFEGNYINNPVGKLNVINGELRTAINLMKYYSIPFYKLQYYLFRTLNKAHITYKPIYIKKESKCKSKIIKFILRKRYKNEYKENLFLANLLSFYQSKNNRTIKINKIDNQDFIYYGKDMRKFNNDLLNNNLSSIYLKIIKEMQDGFKTIEVSNEKDYKKMINITKFLCIYPFITIVIKEE